MTVLGTACKLAGCSVPLHLACHRGSWVCVGKRLATQNTGPASLVCPLSLPQEEHKPGSSQGVGSSAVAGVDVGESP